MTNQKSSYPSAQTSVDLGVPTEQHNAWDNPRPGPRPTPDAQAQLQGSERNINVKLGECHQARHRLGVALSDLEQRLGPFLSPEASPAVPAAPTAPRPPMSPISEELDVLTRGYVEAEKHIDELLSRLEV